MVRSLKLFIMLTLISSNIFAWELLPDRDTSISCFDMNESGEKIILGLSYGGFWLSNDGGENFEPINHLIATDPRIRIYSPLEAEMWDAAGDTIVLKMENAGLSTSSYGWQYAMSLDGGNSWGTIRNVSTDNYSHFLLRDHSNPNRLIHFNRKDISVSDDFGESWDVFEYDDRWNQKYDIFQHPEQDSTFFCYGFPIGSETPDGLWRSDDFGHNWSPLFAPDTLLHFPHLFPFDAVRLSNGKFLVSIFVGMNDSGFSFISKLITSVDGIHWEFEDVGLPQMFMPSSLLEVPGIPGRVFVHSLYNRQISKGLYRSDNYGEHFYRCFNGLPEELTSIIKIEYNQYNNTLYLCSESWGIWQSTDGGDSWTQYDLNLDLGTSNVFSITPEHLFCRGVYTRRLLDYNFQFSDWFDLTDPITNVDTITIRQPVTYTDDSQWITISNTYFDDEIIGKIRIEKSNNHGETWTTLENVFPLGSEDNDLSAYYGEERISLALKTYDENNSATICTSIDTGQTWDSYTDLTLPLDFQVTDNFLFVVDASRQVYKISISDHEIEDLLAPSQYLSGASKNPVLYDEINDNLYVFGESLLLKYDGNEWTIQDSLYQPLYVEIIPRENIPVLLAINLKGGNFIFQLLLSYDEGMHWEHVELPFEKQLGYINEVKYDPWREVVWLSTPVGMMYMDVDDLLNIRDEESNIVPKNFDTLTTYPNPFNASTKIEFILEKTNDVSLKLYDINGRLVRKLLDEKQEAGKHTLSLDGSQLASGTYFLRLDDGQQIHNKKVVLVK